jgi:hypothetical protein
MRLICADSSGAAMVILAAVAEVAADWFALR